MDPEETEERVKTRAVIKTATDLQRLKLEKLMMNPNKPIVIPEISKEKGYNQIAPSFVRNVMGSSAGAGSGEFHVYRHLRRKEYSRQKNIQAMSIKEQQDQEFQRKLEQNKCIAQERTAKKRAKRLKKKERAKKRSGKEENLEDKMDLEKND
ncbi:PRKR-interacting protein 1 homolog [Bactrocera neohumeralis]|uniref:PRKR-interacting protein 1 homolog n=1 Tax=Bactrocera tryoni TaxID=59916 RepID=UPI001A95CF40|nr:PRKR-interacting protein 1 homolog [Bactrocera tryoni]XP_050325749.1 PRKR-interacting protein 1 homolog [Bactrocera neohumeralis]